MVFGIGHKPDGRAAAQKEVEAAKVADQSACGGDDRFRIGLDRLLKRAALVATVGVLTVEPENPADLQPASVSISRLSSTNGKLRSSASIRPSVDFPAPRRPIKAIRDERTGASSWRGAPPPMSSKVARRTRRSVVSSRSASISRSMSHSGDRVVTSPTSSARRALKRTSHLQEDRIERCPLHNPDWPSAGRKRRSRGRGPFEDQSPTHAQSFRGSPNAAENGSLASPAVWIAVGSSPVPTAGSAAV